MTCPESPLLRALQDVQEPALVSAHPDCSQGGHMGTQLWCILHPERKASECSALTFGLNDSY
jgi:hypothetical protein